MRILVKASSIGGWANADFPGQRSLSGEPHLRHFYGCNKSCKTRVEHSEKLTTILLEL